MEAPSIDQTTDLMLLMEAREASQSGRARRVRIAARLSQAEVANVVGVSPFAISRWEAGERAPHGDAALAYARLLRELTAVTERPEEAMPDPKIYPEIRWRDPDGYEWMYSVSALAAAIMERAEEDRRYIERLKRQCQLFEERIEALVNELAEARGPHPDVVAEVARLAAAASE